MSNEALLQALNAVPDPYSGQDHGSARHIKQLRFEQGVALVDMELGYPAQHQHEAITKGIRDAALQLEGVRDVQVSIRSNIVAHTAQRGVQLLPQVKNIIAVASGKGGVGKSTTAANLALALVTQGARVGLLDADIYGPSQPTMLGIAGRPDSSDGKTMSPMRNHGLQVMSIGFLVDKDEAMIWRGPMATQALEQLLRQTNWEDLDYLIVDMPPGTGDIQLTLAQRVPLTGAVIVTTPQDIALMDARKGVAMFEKVGVPILGVVENMAVYCCPQCGHTEHIFGDGGGQRYAQEKGLTYLGALPLNMHIRVQADGGTPTVVAEPQGEITRLYTDIALRVAAKIALKAKDYSNKFPTITISKNT